MLRSHESVRTAGSRMTSQSFSRDRLTGRLIRRRSETSPATAPASRGHAAYEATPLAELRPRGPPFSTRPRFVPHRRWRVAGGPRGLLVSSSVWRTPTPTLLSNLFHHPPRVALRTPPAHGGFTPRGGTPPLPIGSDTSLRCEVPLIARLDSQIPLVTIRAQFGLTSGGFSRPSTFHVAGCGTKREDGVNPSRGRRCDRRGIRT